MAIYGESANIILEQELNQSGISKEDLKNPEKVKSIINKKKTKLGKLKLALMVISTIILFVPSLILTGIITAISVLINDSYVSLNSGRKESMYQKTTSKLESNIKKLEKKLEKEKDTEAKKNLQKSLSELKRSLEKIKKDHENEQFTETHKYQIQDIKNIIETPLEDFFDDKIDIIDLFLIINYYNLSNQEVEKMIKKYMAEMDIEDYEGNVDENIYLKLKNISKNKVIYELSYYDGEYFVYVDNKYISFTNNEIEVFSFENIKSGKCGFGEDYLNKLKESDIYLGYFKLSKPEEDDDVKPFPIK